MKRYSLFRRNGVFYVEDRLEDKQRSLGTRDKTEAGRLLAAYIEADKNRVMNLQMARVYATASEPEIATRTWNDVFSAILSSKKNKETVKRWNSAWKDEFIAKLLHVKLMETTAKQFWTALANGTVSTNVYLRRLHNFALDMNWLLAPIIPKRQWPAVKFGEKRAITREEHDRILAREKNPERHAFYELLWHLGGAQGDVALLHGEDVNWSAHTLSFFRRKLRHRENVTPPLIHFGPEAAAVLQRLPQNGPLFPNLARVRSGDRATEFGQRCDGLGIEGVTLHSYRYAWANRAAESGYPERYAMQALGHGSKAVHRAYARKAKVKIPSLEVYEAAAKDGKVVPFPENAPTTHLKQAAF